jgi:hypothetical protein
LEAQLFEKIIMGLQRQVRSSRSQTFYNESSETNCSSQELHKSSKAKTQGSEKFGGE